MARLIKGNPEIKGVHYGGVSNVITQFADDTGLFLMYTEACTNATLRTLLHVEKNTGLKVSYEKMTIYRVGSLKGTDAKVYTIKPIQWSDGDIEMLGVVLRNSEFQDNSNFNETIEKLKMIINQWVHRNATLMGKVLLVNTLMSSLFVYKMATLIS